MTRGLATRSHVAGRAGTAGQAACLPTLSALRPGPLLRPQPLAVGLPLPSSLAAGPVRRRRRPGCSYRGTRIATEGAMSFAAIWPPVWYEAGRQLRAACRGDGKEGSGWTA